jgi:hypothetical protein
MLQGCRVAGLQGTIEKMTGSGIEMNVGKTKIMRITRHTSPVQLVIEKTPGECGIFHKMHTRFQSNITLLYKM